MKNVIIYFLIACFKRSDWLIKKQGGKRGGRLKKVTYLTPQCPVYTHVKQIYWQCNLDGRGWDF